MGRRRNGWGVNVDTEVSRPDAGGKEGTMNREDWAKWESMTDDQQREAWESARNDLAEERAMYRGLAEAHNAAVTTANVRLAEIAKLKAERDREAALQDLLAYIRAHPAAPGVCERTRQFYGEWHRNADAGKPDHVPDAAKMVAPAGPLPERVGATDWRHLADSGHGDGSDQLPD
jgi:hypothetical protein